MENRGSIRSQIEEKKKEKIEVTFHEGDRTREQEFTFTELEELYNNLTADKARLVAEQIRLSKPVSDTLRKRDEYLQDSLGGLTAQQVGSLIDKMDNFDYSIKQIHVTSGDLVDR